MIRLAKKTIVRLLYRAGYVLLRRSDYEAQPSRSHWLAGDSDFGQFVQRVSGLCNLPPERMFAAYAAARYLVDAEIKGDVLDCGSGDTATLAALAAALVQFGDTTRKLVLFDTSADPTHDAETELGMWGTNRDLLSPQRHRAATRNATPAPPSLLATGYPPDKLSTLRYPRNEIAALGPLAFLNVTGETYPANRDAITTFFPTLVRAGVIAIHGADPDGRDALQEFLGEQRLTPLLLRISANYRIGIRT